MTNAVQKYDSGSSQRHLEDVPWPVKVPGSPIKVLAAVFFPGLGIQSN